MKKLSMLFCALLCVLLPLSALAVTQAEWDQSCRQKTKGDAVIYDRVGEGRNLSLTELGILPEGTYLQVGAYDQALQVWHVTYMQDDVEKQAWMRHSSITTARVNIHFTDGTGIFVNEALANDPDALEAFLKEKYPKKKLNGDGRQSSYAQKEDATPVPEADKEETSEEDEPLATAVPSPSPTPVPTPEPLRVTDVQGQEVIVSQLGSYTSRLVSEEGAVEVLTSTLVFAADVPEDKRIGVIYAPKSGECSLRAEASARAEALVKADAGVIVPILSYGEEFCKVSYKGLIGYVQTNCLSFCDPAAVPLGTGTIIKDGKMDGKSDINIRNLPGRENAKVAGWPTGTEVTVLGIERGWYDVEWNGIRGFVDDGYLLLPEPTATPEPEPTPEPDSTVEIAGEESDIEEVEEADPIEAPENEDV